MPRASDTDPHPLAEVAGAAALQHFVAAAPMAVAMLNRELRYLAASARWRADYRLGDMALEGRCHYDVFPEIPERWRAIHRRCLAEAVAYDEEGAFVRADGVTQWLRWQVQPWRTEAGQVGGLVITSEDVTHRKEVETALRDSEQRYRLMLDSAAAGTWTYDALTDRGGWDDRFAELYGWSLDHPRSFETWLVALHPDDRPAVLARLDAVRHTPGDDTWDVEFRSRRPDGTVVWHHGRGRAERDGQGRVTRLLGIDLDITERKEAEAAQQARDAQQRHACEAADVGVWVWDARTDQTTWSARLCAQYGVSPGDLRTFDDWAARIHPDDRPRVLARLDTVRRTPGDDDWPLEFRIVRPDGEVRWTENRGRAERDAEGRLTRMTGVTLDITARKHQDDALHALRQQQRQDAEIRALLLETAVQGIVSVDSRGAIVNANKAIETMFGYGPGELVGQPVDRLVPSSLAARHAAHRAEYFAAPRPRPMGQGLDLVGQRKDGSTFPIEISLNHAATLSGGSAVAFVSDITERKRAELAMRASEERLRFALAASAAGVWTFDPRRNEVSWDERLHAQQGFAPDAPRVDTHWVDRVQPDDAAHLQTRLTHIVQTPGDDDLDVEVRARRPDGTFVWLHLLGRAERDEAGCATRLTGISLDISARKQIETALVEHRDLLHAQTRELQHRADQLQRLASEITLAEQRAREQLAKTLHDGLQQLLFSSRLKLERGLRRAAEGRGDGTDLLQRAKQELDEAIGTARSLAVELSPSTLHARGLPEALHWLAEHVREKYALMVDLVADPTADLDRRDVRTLIFESVRELLFNVVKHAHVDRVALELARTAEGTLRVSVTDQGAGFDPVVAFDPARSPSAGLGLFAIRERLALLGASMEVESAPGQGARFQLLVPPTEVGAATDLSDASARPPGAVSRSARSSVPAGVRRLAILVADDHALVRGGLRELLADYPMLQVVGEAMNGAEAVELAHALNPDVVLMDVAMPILDGIEATRRIHEALPHVRVVGLSTEARLSHGHAIEAAGAVAYFTKGGDATSLLARLLALHADLASSAEHT